MVKVADERTSGQEEEVNKSLHNKRQYKDRRKRRRKRRNKIELNQITRAGGRRKERNARNHANPKHRLRVLEFDLPCVESGRAGDEDGSPAKGELDICVLMVLGEELGTCEVLWMSGIMVS